MADKLTYKGGATVVGHTGTEIELVRPSKGSMHRFPRWWNKKGTVAYIECAIFKVTLASGLVVRLVVPSDGGARTLEIRHDGNGNFTFPIKGSTERIAVIAESSSTIYREYQFSKISGGSVLTRTLNAYPAGVAFSDGGSITGTLEVGETITINGASYSGGFGSMTADYVLQKSDTGSGGWTTVVVKSSATSTYTLAAGLDTKYLRVSAQITDDSGLQTRNSASVGPITS
jgi:hypothetical protein